MLSFTRVHPAAYDVSAEGGALLVGKPTGGAITQVAVCAGHVMSAGRHAAEFTVIQAADALIYLGVARPGIGVKSNAIGGPSCWALSSPAGRFVHSGKLHEWEGQQPFKQGDVMGLLLDCDAGTMAVKKNGVRLGVAATGLMGKFCWAVALWKGNSCPAIHIRIAAAEVAGF
jgi:hypothetical protein